MVVGLDTTDWTVIGVYLCSIVVVGLYVQKKASGSIDAFFLGSNSIPWYV